MTSHENQQLPFINCGHTKFPTCCFKQLAKCKLKNWNSLQHRREYLSLVECYKTVFGLNGLDFNDYFECCRSKSTRANHPFKIQTKSARINAFKYSFFVRIIKEWNNLPNHLFGHDINDINANRFKSSLKKWMNIH